MNEAEERHLHYPTKLPLTANVKRLINRVIADGNWLDADQGFRGCEATLKLTGWTRHRRVINLKRRIDGEILFARAQAETGLYRYR